MAGEHKRHHTKIEEYNKQTEIKGLDKEKLAKAQGRVAKDRHGKADEAMDERRRSTDDDTNPYY